MSADGTPDPTPRDTLARVFSSNGRHCHEDTWVNEYVGQRIAEAILSSPEARAAVIAATPRDELLAALVADGTLPSCTFCGNYTPNSPTHPKHGVTFCDGCLASLVPVLPREPQP